MLTALLLSKGAQCSPVSIRLCPLCKALLCSSCLELGQAGHSTMKRVERLVVHGGCWRIGPNRGIWRCVWGPCRYAREGIVQGAGAIGEAWTAACHALLTSMSQFSQRQHAARDSSDAPQVQAGWTCFARQVPDACISTSCISALQKLVLPMQTSYV